MSDKVIIQHSGFLECIEPADTVLADRVHDELEVRGAKLEKPVGTHGKKQLSRDAEKTQHPAHVRIHVERVIGQMRKKYRKLYKFNPVRLS